MAGKENEPLTTGTDLKYPWVDLVTASMMPLMYFNTLAAWYLLSLNTPRLLMEPSMKALESGSSYKRKAGYAQASRHGKSRKKIDLNLVRKKL